MELAQMMEIVQRNNICTATKCACSADSYRKGGTECATRIALNVTCTDSAHCIVNAECRDDGAGNRCYCKDSHNPDGNTCVTKVAYGDACTGSGVGNCAETTHIVCDTTCKCDTGFFRKTTAAECSARVGFEIGCDAAQIASDQCSVDETECKEDAGTDKMSL
ncbi:unnamed protein product [Mytilus edulis]|uniref:Uncharacterized protein n=1 Tax=Mytilus edulis TaxID=6550 RepID=A0A8S3U9C7_MYTED|nr:unnamed protein product [Mytilus edulis]